MPCIPICMRIVYKLYKYNTNINNNKQDNIILTNSSIVIEDGIEISTPTIMISNPLITTTNTNTVIAVDNNYDSNILDDIVVEDREGNSISIKDNTY